ncbi:hypothetical protein FHG87_013169 [Trinorchestia longiramus]|nr:hypothetical protein FHG87_013169 [Trinorchestia longiramus]
MRSKKTSLTSGVTKVSDNNALPTLGVTCDAAWSATCSDGCSAREAVADTSGSGPNSTEVMSCFSGKFDFSRGTASMATYLLALDKNVRRNGLTDLKKWNAGCPYTFISEKKLTTGRNETTERHQIDNEEHNRRPSKDATRHQNQRRLAG